MKYLKYFLVASVVVFTSYTIKTSRLSESVYPGNPMPEFNLTDHSGTKFDLRQMRGQKVLVSFWATYDANSHKNNVLLYNTLNENGYPIRMVSICFDKNKSVFEKTLKMDGIDKTTQFQDVLGSSSKLYQAYGLKNGFNNYLIDEEGVVLAVNVTPDELKNFTHNNVI